MDSIKISDLDGMTVGRLRELLAGIEDDKTLHLDRAYYTNWDETVNDLSELVIGDDESAEFAEDCDRLFHQTQDFGDDD